MHLSAAKTLLELEQADRRRAQSSEVVDFVSKFFVLKDSLGRSACGNGPKFELLSMTSSDEVLEHERYMRQVANFKLRLIHL